MPKAVRLFLLWLGVLVLAGLAGGWWWLTTGRWPLAGELRHDFGEVEINGPSTEVRHVFRLVNRRDRPLEVEAIVPSCGCAGADPSTERIPPGGTLELDAALRLSHAGVRTSTITLMLDDGGETVKQVVWLRGTGVKGSGLVPGAEEVALAPGEERRVLFTAELLETTEEPPAPELRVPEGVEATFERWSQIVQGDPRRRTATRWRGWVTVRFPATMAGSLPGDAVLEAEIPGAPPASVGLSVLPAGAGPQGDGTGGPPPAAEPGAATPDLSATPAPAGDG